jgi:ABC-type sulfate/molybdate transport systems ATPase subunit
VLAAAFVGAPRVLLLDEPLEAMDRSMRDAVLGWVGEARERGATAVIATHDLEELSRLADRAVGLDGGRIERVERLPEDSETRRNVLERLARGVGLTEKNRPVESS